jgi:hypothetical protein
LGFPHVEIRNFTYPAGVALLAGDDKTERSFWRSQCVAVATVGKQNNTIGKVRIKLRQREHDLVPVRGPDDDVESQTRSFELLAKRGSCSTKQLHRQDALVGDTCPLIIRYHEALAGKRREAGLADD